MSVFRAISFLVTGCAATLLNAPLFADDLFSNSEFAAVASDRVASDIGDTLSVIVYQAAEARNSSGNSARRRSVLDGGFSVNSNFEDAQLSIGSDYVGRGEVRRSESFITRISAVVEDVMPNGDLLIAGEQLMFVNGEETVIRVRGRIRAADISADNEVLSSRLADAQISYDGQGFVSRSTEPGLIHSLFSWLGLG